MKDTINLRLSPEIAYDIAKLKVHLNSEYGISEETPFKLLRRSIDARSKNVVINLSVLIGESDNEKISSDYFSKYKNVRDAAEVHIIGAGPAGLFAALRLLEHGIKPVIIERGKNVRDRRRDLAALNKEHVVNPESNYCFGEGGAGTYSDGKLYTRSNKRGNIQSVLDEFFGHGAKEEIMIDAHPHIGTNKLPAIITSMRDTIINCGGEIHFNKRLDDIILSGQKLKAIQLSDGSTLPVKQLILATGHSARDIFKLLQQKAVDLAFKPFALGVRVEHPQALIDKIQYHCDSRGAYLPAASYSLVSQINNRGVFSFCMCPGGIIAPCATAPGEVVTNGWSPSKRNNPYSNSGIVTEIKWDDLKVFQKDKALAGLSFQAEVERNACIAGGNTQKAPAQRLEDFVKGKISGTLPQTSYQPGTASVNLVEVLPDFVYTALAKAFVDFGKKMKGYFTNEAVVHAVESRTSSPVRIPRDESELHHPEILNLFPCGEGAGYAGGIVSAAMDGQKIADKVAQKLKNS